MKGNIGKGTECFRFFSDFYKLLGNYWMIESNDDYWSGLMQASDKLLEEYKECDFYLFARALVLVLNVYLSDVKYGQKKKGHWVISFKGD